MPEYLALFEYRQDDEDTPPEAMSAEDTSAMFLRMERAGMLTVQ